MTRLRVTLVCLAIIAFAGCGMEEQVKPEEISLSEWEPLMQVRFPPGSVALGLQQMGGGERLVRLKVSMPAEQWPAFLTSAPIDATALSDRRRILLGPDEDWWDPSKPASLPTAQARLENGSVLNVGSHEDPSGTVIVYLLWHET